MLAEAECISVAETPHTIFCAAGTPGRARFGALKLLEEGADRLISFGIAGALDPARSPGDIVLASHVEDHAGQRFSTDSAWRQELARRYRNIGSVTEGAIVTTDSAVAATMRSDAFPTDNFGAPLAGSLLPFIEILVLL